MEIRAASWGVEVLETFKKGFGRVGRIVRDDVKYHCGLILLKRSLKGPIKEIVSNRLEGDQSNLPYWPRGKKEVLFLRVVSFGPKEVEVLFSQEW